MSDVNTTAESFLSELVAKGAELLEVETSVPLDSIYDQDNIAEAVQRIDAEYVGERFDASDALEEVVFKRGHAYLYGECKGTVKWTYDVRLAKRFILAEGERLVRHFEGVSMVPAPEV